MTDKVLEAINTEISELNDRLTHLRSVRDAYKHPATAERISGAEVADELTNWITKYNPDFVFKNDVAAKGINRNSGHTNQGIRVLLERKIITDATPSKARYKDYALTAKGKALLFPNQTETKDPKPRKDNSQAKARLKAAREKKEAKSAKAKASSPGTRQKQLLEYLQKTKYFTREQAAKDMEYPSVNSAQVTMDKYNRDGGGKLYAPLRRDGKTMTYVSLLYKQQQPNPPLTSGTTTATAREVRITPGEGVLPGRLREVK